MDKYEYKVCADEIIKLIGEERYIEAAEIADTIDWRKVRSVSMLLRVAALYRVNRRNEDGRDILLLAYERYPSNRSVIYSLCEVSIELDDVVAAIEYCKEYAKYAQGDNSLYILRYKILEAQEASLEERIHVLEEYKKRDYQEEWAYELAYLYHRVGLGTKCVEECDDLILWFGDGPYVKKAMELKMLHAPLTNVQQKKYDFEQYGDERYMIEEANAEYVSYEEQAPQQTDSIDMSQYNTINLQKVVAESMRELFPEDEDIYQAQQTELAENQQMADSYEAPIFEEEAEAMQSSIASMTQEQETVAIESEVQTETNEEIEYIKERPDITELVEGVTEQMPTVDVGAVKKVIVPDNSSVFMQDMNIEEIREITEEAVMEEQSHYEESGESVITETPKVEYVSGMAYAYEDENTQITLEGCEDAAVQVPVQEEYAPEVHSYVRPLTGQMDIEEVISEWERLKKESAERYEQETRQRVLQQTGSIFAEFDQSIKSGPWADLTVGANTIDVMDEVEELEEIVQDNEEVIEHEDIEEIAEVAGEAEFEEITEIEAATDTIEEILYEEPEILEHTEEEEEVIAAMAELPEEDEELLEVEGNSTMTYRDADNMQEMSEEWNMSDSMDFEEAMEYEESMETEEAMEYEEIMEYEDSVEYEVSEEEYDVLEESAEYEDEAMKTQDIMLNTAEIGCLPEKIIEATEKETTGVERQVLREFTPEEQELFENFTVSKKIKKQILFAIDKMSLAAYTGNVVITGEPGLGTLRLAKNLIREFQAIDANFSGKVAKITGSMLNEKDLREVFNKLDNGAIIIEKANGLTEDTLYEMTNLLNQDNLGIIVFMEDTKKEITKLLEKQAMVADYFNIRIDLAEMDNNALVAYAKRYALELEYSIDELATLALHTRISSIQTGNRVVTKTEIEDIVDEAIWKSRKFRLKNFIDILLSRRYDEEDMIILKERDFM